MSKIRPFIKFLKKNYNYNKLIGAEIGVKKGVNALSIVSNLNIEKLFLIDSWIPYITGTKSEKKSGYCNKDVMLKWMITTYDLFKNKENVQIIQETSIIAVNRFEDYFFDFVYIDGAHDFFSVSEDIRYWLPKVKNGGVLAGHDFNNHETEVAQAVKSSLIDFIDLKEDWVYIKK